MKVEYDTVRLDGRLEKTCEHGVGHTVGHKRGHLQEAEGIHGCDGCCRDYEVQRVDEEDEKGGDEEPNKTALVNHPSFGSLWLEKVRVIDDDWIEGQRLEPDPVGLGGYWWATYNFPITCVRKWGEKE